MALYSECEMPYTSYRERIAVSDGKVHCCETGILIPLGYPYALCQGTYDDPEAVQEWCDHPQCIEAWRFLRAANQNHNICFNFEGAEEEMSYFAEEGGEGQMFLRSWFSMKKRTKSRYEQGLRPRLWSHERESMQSGEFSRALAYSTRKKQ